MKSTVACILILASMANGQSMGDGISKTTYSSSEALTGLAFNLEYLPSYIPSDNCNNNVCDCVIDDVTYDIDQGRVALTVDSISEIAAANGGVRHLSQMPGPSNDGFGLHLVNCSTNYQPGGMTTQEVEAEFATKCGDMSTYDAFMDYNVALLTSDLDSYANSFDAGSVDYLPIHWEDQNENYYGLMILVPTTQMVIEIMQPNSTNTVKVATHPKLLKMNEVRHPKTSILRAQAKMDAQLRARKPGSANTDILTALTVGRAASNLDALDQFYISGMENSVTLSYNSVNNVSKRCYLWDNEGATVDVCFTKRADSATAGDFKVSDFENMLNNVHQTIINNPDEYDCANKWADNHYAIDSSDKSVTSDYVLNYVNSQSGIFVYCEDSTPHYIADPTGWGVQLDLVFTTSLATSMCSSSDSSRRRLQPPPPMDDMRPPMDDEQAPSCVCSFMTACFTS